MGNIWDGYEALVSQGRPDKTDTNYITIKLPENKDPVNMVGFYENIAKEAFKLALKIADENRVTLTTNIRLVSFYTRDPKPIWTKDKVLSMIEDGSIAGLSSEERQEAVKILT